MTRCCDITSGQLRNKIALQELQTTPDGAGGQDETWVTIKEPMARIRPMSGNERLQAMKLEGTVTHRMVMRYQAGVHEKLRVLYKNRPMQIRAVLNLEERNQWLELYVDEGVAT